MNVIWGIDRESGRNMCCAATPEIEVKGRVDAGKIASETPGENGTVMAQSDKAVESCSFVHFTS